MTSQKEPYGSKLGFHQVVAGSKEIKSTEGTPGGAHKHKTIVSEIGPGPANEEY